MTIFYHTLEAQRKTEQGREPRDQSLTSLSGLIVTRGLSVQLNCEEPPRACFRHLLASRMFEHCVIVLFLVVHLLLGCRESREIRYYCDARLPDKQQIPRVGRAWDPIMGDRL